MGVSLTLVTRGRRCSGRVYCLVSRSGSLSVSGFRSPPCKAVVSWNNQANPCSLGNTILHGVFPCDREDHGTLSSMAVVYVPAINGLRSTGVTVGHERHAVQLISTGDLNVISMWLGFVGASSRKPSIQCTVMHKRTKKSGD